MRIFAGLVLAVTAASVTAAPVPSFRTHTPRVLRAESGLTGPSTAAPADVVRQYLNRSEMTLALRAQNQGQSGVTHVRMEQTFGGKRVYGATVKASVDPLGRITSLIDDTATPRSIRRASITAAGAMQSALAHHYAGRFDSLDVVAIEGHETRFVRDGFFHREPTATAVMIPMADGAFEEGFLVETWEEESNILWHTLVGTDGQIVHRELRTNTDSYFVFTNSPTRTPQSVVAGPGTGNTESPAGWVTADTTIGNNVDAYLDRDNNNAADAGGRPVSATRDFIYTFDGSSAPTTVDNQKLAVANLFYLNNVIHDKLYRHGFNEAAGNFQTNNFGKGGSGNDPVNAEAQDGGGTNNANFSTPADGSRPRMQMYIWTRTTPNRDGDLDSDVVFHEYGHGLTWRMIGSMSGGLAGAIGEGMADTVALYMNKDDAVGEYSYNSAAGIRRYQYTNYPLTYGDATGGSVHNDGEIYAATMWKLRSLWLASGRTEDALWNYVVDGMNYTPANPEYEEMRDGILQAMPTQADDCIVWDAFSQFGIGVNAVGTDSCGLFSCSVKVTEDFSKPAVCGGTPPPPAGITLSVRGYKTKGVPRADLTWANAAGTTVDIYRNGAVLTNTANDGAHTDSTLPKTAGTYRYKVCETGTTTCSPEQSVSF